MPVDRRSLCLAVLAIVLAIAPAAAKNTGLIFVSNEKSNNLIVLDPKTHKVVKDIKTSRRPRDMHFSADRSKLYVACGDDDVIEVIDMAKLEVIGRIPTGQSPETFALDERRRRIYIANEESSTLAIIDIDKGIIVHEVPTGGEPEGVLLSEDGKIIYVTSEVGNLVHMVDTEGGHVINDVVVGTRPRRFAATPDRKELWVTAELSGEVYIIDREKFEVSGKIEFLPPRDAQERRDAGRPGDDLRRQDCVRDARPCRPRRRGRCAHAPDHWLYPGRQTPVGNHAHARRAHALRGQWPRRRRHDHRRAQPQGAAVCSRGARTLGRDHR